ncbi:hypothetical protein A2Y85_04310 [candidate division WOR-3 bacterium RBG_13_43_14]|uniref:DUF4139 domain-containing protein n=1 Tax=candidate division WOR-3 bacterium RBG_13_43_14 TaxID=1802590 RepID=A0A1F4UEZ3_UNCW3|nr:MAG: hypothetical protein A2Y85_04310 [candidate division WOR-3 bacterium RBG_13_43_14]
MKTRDIRSRIDSVIVYSDRVLVTRIVDIEFHGSQDIFISDLPGAIDDQTLRIKSKDLRVGEVMVKQGYLKVVSPKVKAIEDKIKKLLIKDRALIDEGMVLQDKQKFLISISVSVPETISKELFTGKVAPTAWRQGLQFLTVEMTKAKNRIAEIERERVDLKEQVDAFKKQLSDIRAVTQNRKTIIFDAHASSAKKYRIEITYVIYGGSWHTYYELRGRLATGKIDLAYFGKVNQRTGEDWDNVRLALSTAQPILGGTPVEPSPWYIDIYQPDRERLAPLASKRAAAAPAEIEAEVADRYEEYVQPVDTGIAITYPLPGRYSIKSGEPNRKIKIVEHTFDADYEYFIVPRYGELAYSQGEFKNTSNYLFIAGDANTYVGDDLTGSIYINTIATDAKTKISFGVDERVKVERKMKKYHVSKGGLVKKVTKYEYQYESIVKNFHRRDIKCMIIDQIPLSQNPDLKVIDVQLDPKPTKDDRNLQIFTWEITIPAGKEFKITAGFIVDAPYDSQVSGL